MKNYILYAHSLAFLFFSWLKSREKTLKALKKAWKSMENIMPQLLVVFLLVGILLAVLEPAFITRFIGEGSGWLGVVAAALAGSVTLIPPVVAMPMAAMLLDAGAGYLQIAAFISTLQMVGIITLPLEIRHFGQRTAILRNATAFLFSFVVAGLMGLVIFR